MKIAVTSQNRREITEHAGRCRTFWVYQVDAGRLIARELLELPQEQSFHDSDPHDAHPLDQLNVLISRSMGPGLARRLAAKGILGVVTDEYDPDTAVRAFAAGTLRTHGADQGHHPTL